MSDAPAVVPSEPARLPLIRRWARFRVSIRGLMALVALSALGIYGYQIYQDYALVAPMIRSLRTGNNVAKINALNALGRLGRRAWLAERSLIAATKDQDMMVRGEAIRALIQVAPRSTAAVQALVEALESGGNEGPGFWQMGGGIEIHDLAAYALMETGPASAETVRALGALARKGDSGLRDDVIFILSRIGTPTNGAAAIIREALEDRDAAVVMQALDALVPLDPEPARTLAAIRKVASRPPDQWTGSDGFNFMSDLGPAESIRKAVAQARLRLASQGEPPPGLTDDLLTMLDDPIEDIRHAAGDALARLGPVARRKAVAVYADKLRAAGDDLMIAREVAWNLVRFDPENRGALPAIVARLESNDPAVSMEAIVELGTLGQSATPAAPALARAMMGENAWWSVSGFLTSIPEPGKLAGRWPILSRARAGRADSPLKLGAIALRTIGERGQAEAVRIFIDALVDPDDAEHRAPAARALGALGPAARAAIPALKRARADERFSVRGAARAALQKIERKAEAVE